MMRISLDEIEEGYSHIDLSCEASEIVESLEGGYLVSPVEASLDLNRSGNQILVTGNVVVKAVLECARCLENFEVLLSSPVDILCLTGGLEATSEQIETWDSIIEVPTRLGYIDLTGEMRSMLLVLIPIKPLCRPDCKGLCPTCGANLNKTSCSCSRERYDPRWDVLKRLKENL